MLRIDRDKQTFSKLDTPSLAESAITERYHLQEFICNSSEDFFAELGEKLFVIGKEIEPSKNVPDRIDILAVDKEGQIVIVELKRASHKLHMLQAISYAAMIADWQPEDFLAKLTSDRAEALAEFLEVGQEEINRKQRVILIAEAFDYAVLISAEWLNEQYGVDIVCCKLAIAKDVATNSEFLAVSNVFPAPEIAQQAVKRRRGGGVVVPKPAWASWEDALSTITNQDVVAFFKQEIQAGTTNYLRKKSLRFYLGNKRRWWASAKKQHAYVWQVGRFEGDVDFWKKEVSQSNEIEPVKNATCLRFYLSTKQDFDRFKEAVTQKLGSVEWSAHDGDGIEEAD